MAEPFERIASFAPAASGRRYVVMDVFTDSPLTGNPLAVFTDGRGLCDADMQALARELNLSETVFVLPPQGGGDVRVRIFTPAQELPFAGHPLLGAAILAGEALGLEGEALGLEGVTLETARGEVPVVLERGGRFGRMRQPIPSWRPYERERELLTALGVQRSRLPVEAYSNGPEHVYVELHTEEQVRALVPDLRALAALGPITVSVLAGAGVRWRTRVFAPGLGVGEDPATGSAAGPLAVHLARHGRIVFGQEIELRQGMEIGRPSLLYTRAEGSPARVTNVEVGGGAVVLARGQLVG